MIKCIACGSEKLARERRLEGNDICQHCGLTYPSRLTNMMQNRVKQAEKQMLKKVLDIFYNYKAQFEALGDVEYDKFCNLWNKVEELEEK